jgi:predicted CoA-binding protein
MEQTDIEKLISDFIALRVWAVVGVSQDPAKYGNRIYRSLLASGYQVYPVNPRGGEIDGATVYPSLVALPQTPEVVDLVVPPAVTEQVVQEVKDLGLTRVWMQPGSESETAIAYCRQHGIQVVHDACAMALRRNWS